MDIQLEIILYNVKEKVPFCRMMSKTLEEMGSCHCLEKCWCL